MQSKEASCIRVKASKSLDFIFLTELYHKLLFYFGIFLFDVSKDLPNCHCLSPSNPICINPLCKFWVRIQPKTIYKTWDLEGSLNLVWTEHYLELTKTTSLSQQLLTSWSNQSSAGYLGLWRHVRRPSNWEKNYLFFGWHMKHTLVTLFNEWLKVQKVTMTRYFLNRSVTKCKRAANISNLTFFERIKIWYGGRIRAN